MSIVQNADVLNQNSMATDKASYVQQIQRGRDVHSLTIESRQKMCDDIRDLKKASQRTDYMLSLDHCLYEKSKFIQEQFLKKNLKNIIWKEHPWKKSSLLVM